MIDFIITTAVTENKPELITNHPAFDVTRLKADGCGIVECFNFDCGGLLCFNCPFGNLTYDGSNPEESQTIQSMRQWLKLDTLNKSITYTEKEVFSILDKVFHAYASDHRIDAKEWFDNNKKI